LIPGVVTNFSFT